MTFSPFYMGNQVEPQIPVDPEGYVQNENWGAQLNFMIPLDGSIIERCKSAADRQIEKMQLNYELVRIDNCSKLLQKGLMIRPDSRVYHLCSDIISIKEYLKQQNPPEPKEKSLIQKINPFNKK